MNGPDILIVAGEASGDLHAGPVAAELKKLLPEASLWGVGGTELVSAGVECLERVENLAVMGFSGVPRLLPRLRRLKGSLLRRTAARGTRLAILVDYPGFNLNLARALKRLPHPPRVLYYIAPQVWAWNRRRLARIKTSVDRLAVILPFEAPFFARAGVPADFVGHPLLDRTQGTLETPAVSGATTVALLPGSRRQEVVRLLPVMVDAALRLQRTEPGLRVVVAKSPGLDESLYRLPGAAADGWELRAGVEQTLGGAAVAAVCSGTATLEAALWDVPQVVVYRTSALNYALARALVRLEFIALVNLTAGGPVVPELIQRRLTARRLADEMKSLLTDARRAAAMRQAYQRVREALGEPGAAVRVARLAVRMLAEV